MRRAFLLSCGLAALSASCHDTIPSKALASGCYYAGGKPVFKISGSDGRVLIPGSVRTFKALSGQDEKGSFVTFSPGFFFDDEDPNGVPLSVGTDPDREPFRLPLETGTRVATIKMNWTTYGNEDVELGAPC